MHTRVQMLLYHTPQVQGILRMRAVARETAKEKNSCSFILQDRVDCFCRTEKQRL